MIIGRLTRGALLLLVVSALSFLLLDAAPGDPFADAGFDAGISAETTATIRGRHDLDAPAAVRYGRWLRGALTGDLGRSYLQDAPVADLLGARLPNTLLLGATALALAWVVGVPLGAWSVARPRSLPGRLARVASGALTIVPDVALALAAVAAAALTGWLPAGGMGAGEDEAGAVAAIARHLVLPALVLGALQLPAIMRHTEGAMRRTLDAPLTQALRARGVSDTRIVVRHALRLASAPLAALLGLSLAGLLSQSLVIEVVFGWPGLGPLLLEAVLARDAPVVLASVMASTTLLLLGTALGDGLTRLMDPRLRAQ